MGIISPARGECKEREGLNLIPTKADRAASRRSSLEKQAPFLLNKSRMSAIPSAAFLAAALLCSFIGRALLVKAAFGVSAGWGFTVLFVPFGPLFFRMQYRELAYPTRYWRMATGPLLLLFFVDGGTSTSVSTLTELKSLWKPASTTEAGDTHFHLPKLVPVATNPGQPAATPTPGPTPVSTPAVAAAASTPAPAPTPSKAVAASAAAMPAAPRILNPAERLEANRREFERLADWYDRLKHERGYLRKGDTEAVVAFNTEVAQYEAALQLAKTEEAELAKLTAKK
jgi:hypothetical protein